LIPPQPVTLAHSEEDGQVFVKLGKMEQHYDAVREVLRDGFAVT
jgi:hypothetical protein